MQQSPIAKHRESLQWLRDRGYTRNEEGFYEAGGKPQIRWSRELWIAQGADSTGIGDTPAEAHTQWKITLLSKADDLQTKAILLKLQVALAEMPKLDTPEEDGAKWLHKRGALKWQDSWHLAGITFVQKNGAWYVIASNRGDASGMSFSTPEEAAAYVLVAHEERGQQLQSIKLSSRARLRAKTRLRKSDSEKRDAIRNT